jgi:hypothetical protein
MSCVPFDRGSSLLLCCAIMVGMGGLTPSPLCHCGDNGWLPPPIRWIMERLHDWVVISSDEGGALGTWRLLIVFPAKSFVWIIWVGKLDHLTIGICYLFLGRSQVHEKFSFHPYNYTFTPTNNLFFPILSFLSFHFLQFFFSVCSFSVIKISNRNT